MIACIFFRFLAPNSSFKEVFDLLDPEQRAKCTEVEKDLLNKVYAGIVTVSSDKTDKMQRSDGSTTWMRLLKWVEYTLED